MRRTGGSEPKRQHHKKDSIQCSHVRRWRKRLQGKDCRVWTTSRGPQFSLSLGITQDAPNSYNKEEILYGNYITTIEAEKSL
jgi:hypothetical protein